MKYFLMVMGISLLFSSVTIFVFFGQGNMIHNNINNAWASSSASEPNSDIMSLPPVGDPVPSSKNPFSSAQGAPKLMLEYNNTAYPGELRSAVFESGDVDNNMPSLGDESSNITAIIPEQRIDILQNTPITIYVTENPEPENQPNSISVTAYYVNGTVSKILSLNEGEKLGTFTVDLEKGEYIFLTVATWLPETDNYLTSSGYVTYVFRINVL